METLAVTSRPEINTRSNCIGFAYWYLGINTTEQRVTIPRYEELLKQFEEVAKDEAEVFAISDTLPVHERIVWHMAPRIFICGNDKDFVIHRRGNGASVNVEPLEDVVKRYGVYYGVSYLRRIPKQTCI